MASNRVRRRTVDRPLIILKSIPARLESFMAQFSNALPSDSSSAWTQAYECAILELDGNKLPSRLAETGCAIHDRAEEILTCSSLAEHRGLNNALHTLRLLEETAAREKPAAQPVRQLCS
jgi:hypothetical protein